MNVAKLTPLLPLVASAIGWIVIYLISVKSARRAELRQICNRITDITNDIICEICEDKKSKIKYLSTTQESKINGDIEKIRILDEQLEKYSKKTKLSHENLINFSGVISDITRTSKDSNSTTSKGSDVSNDKSSNALVVSAIEAANEIAADAENVFATYTSNNIGSKIEENLDIISGVFIGFSMSIFYYLIFLYYPL